MFKISHKQMMMLSADQEVRFRHQLARHIRRFFPEHTEALSPEQLDINIRYGIERAQHHRFKARSEIARYLNLMFEFGRDFDIDPACAWATRILATNIPRRMEYLYDSAMAALQQRKYVSRQ